MTANPGTTQAMEPSPRFCPNCGASVPPHASFCPRCGTLQPGISRLGSAPSSSSPPPGPLSSWTGPAAPYLSSAVAADRSRTVTGLLLLVIGFALDWIPYIDVIGGLLALIGIIFVFLGRRGYGPLHHRYVVIGGILFVLTVVAGIIFGAAFVAAIFSQVPPAGSSLSSFGSALQSDLATLFIGTAVLGVLGALSQVIMVYALADPTTRTLLWAGFAAGAVLSIVVLVVIWPAVATAVSQATSGTTLNMGPIDQLETAADLLGLTKVVAAVLFAWAYLRCRNWALGQATTPVR